MSDASPHDACGCCGGVSALTPALVENRPGLSALAFRAGTHARFKESMLARLSTLPRLRALTTRDDDDPTIALLDGWAAVLDVLTFYQERIANEGYLRTATERRSILELARTIGYELGPGVAASTWLAFTLDDSPGSPREVVIPASTRAQSLPSKIELPQSFETAEEILARPEWNALKPALTEPQTIEAETTREALLAGAALGLGRGDALLWITDREHWDVRTLTEVEARSEDGVTRVAWTDPLETSGGSGVRVYALRQRASLFGHNAPDWKALAKETRDRYAGSSTEADKLDDWPGIAVPKESVSIDLDAEYPRIVRGSWVVLAQPGARLFEVRGVSSTSTPGFSLSTKRTHLVLDAGTGVELNPRQAAVFAQSEELALAERPVNRPVAGTRLALDRQVEGLAAGRTVIVRGRLSRAVVGSEPLQLQPLDGSAPRQLQPGETLVVLALPFSIAGRGQVWTLRCDDGVEGTVLVSAPPRSAVSRASRSEVRESAPEATFVGARSAISTISAAKRRATFNLADRELPDIFVPPDRVKQPGVKNPPRRPPKEDIPSRPEEIPPVALALAPAEKDDPVVSEVAVLDDAFYEEGRTALVLKQPLVHVYDPATVTVHANVGKATHGETKREVLGSGDAARAFQRFRLRQKPLTYVSAPVPSGGASTLELRVNGVLWHEAPDLLQLGPRDRAYVLRRDDGGTVTALFGDGIHGARPASGIENVEAVYRVGIGAAGSVGEDRIALLATRPLGVKSVTNPVAATGAADPEVRDDARRNAPRTVLTLDRVVSLRDFEDYARGFAGIGKAQARMLWKGGLRSVHLTVAAADGKTVQRSSELFRNLVASLEGARDPHQALEVSSFEPVLFRVSARAGVDPDFRKEDVLPRAEAALREAFSFAARDFGQGVALSEVMAVLQAVDGVVGVDVEALHLSAAPPS
ncbi:MAG TPA: putative baseplate assembly protein, partial [Thermoanaerobaculia bacterium]|nr:putative baseplate assembly protein [Thermoanaerobaculia bacterium]